MDHRPLGLVIFLFGLSITCGKILKPSSDKHLIQKRETSGEVCDKLMFIEEKLIEHSQALEHLVKMAENTQDLTNRLVEHLSKQMSKPTMPERIENGRRSFLGSTEPDRVALNKNNPWCTAALLCKPDAQSFCAFDDVLGNARFDDKCHMLKVNCYYNHKFSVLPACPV